MVFLIWYKGLFSSAVRKYLTDKGVDPINEYVIHNSNWTDGSRVLWRNSSAFIQLETTCTKIRANPRTQLKYY